MCGHSGSRDCKLFAHAFLDELVDRMGGLVLYY